MNRALSAVLALACFATPALAQDCYPWDAMGDPDAATLYEIGEPQVRFLANGGDRPGCPSASGCERTAYLVDGDVVVGVPDDAGDLVCAVYVGGAPNYAVTAGWLPADPLAEIDEPAPSLAGLVGRWRYGQFHSIDLQYGADPSALIVSGDAAYGADDPQRVASGGVNIGSIDDVLVRPEDGEVAFTVDWDGKVGPYDADSDFCAVRMWRKGPYLAVTDNFSCGGNNVTFGGVYRQVSQ